MENHNIIKEYAIFGKNQHGWMMLSGKWYASPKKALGSAKKSTYGKILNHYDEVEMREKITQVISENKIEFNFKMS